MIHPEAIAATERLYNAWRTGDDVRVTDVINQAINKALTSQGRTGIVAVIRNPIIRAVSVATGCHQDEITGRSKISNLVWPRHLSMLLLHDSGLTCSAIDRIFRRKNGCAFHGIRRAQEMVQSYPDREGALYLRLKKELGL